MHSYIGIHHFTPRAHYQAINELVPVIEQTMTEQNVSAQIGKENFNSFREDIIRCMEVYYKLVGIDDTVIAGRGAVVPRGVLPRYTESLIGYFQSLERKIPADKEISILEYSGVDTIKIRYKYTDSVIKKLVKLALHDQRIFEKPLKIFVKGGALHDLVGIQFVCSFPYEKEWIARTLYNFFEYANRTDDHLLYGFYRVEKKSGYRGLHCDHTLFNPRFDEVICRKRTVDPVEPDRIFTLLEAEDEGTVVLQKLKDYFNVEIQLHTTFENLWSSMEHKNSYNIQAKGSGRNSKITVQWKMLSDNMKNLEKQFERLQVDTEQARFEILHHEEYIAIKELLDQFDSNLYFVHEISAKKMTDIEDDLKNHEISRQDYVEQLLSEASSMNDFASKQKEPTVQIIFRMHSAFIYYGLASQSQYFNTEDIRVFVKKALKSYGDISFFLSDHPEIYKGNLINIVAIYRYLTLAQKYGLGMIHPPKELFDPESVTIVDYEESLALFENGIALLLSLSEGELNHLNKESAKMMKIIHQYEVMAREWELFNTNAARNEKLATDIALFRKRFIVASLQEKFQILLESDKIKNIGFVVKFYTTLLWYGFLRPRDALKEIIKYSAYDKIEASDLFYYELSSYRFLILEHCESIDDCRKPLEEREVDPVKIEHYRNYHRKNMIQLLFRIRKHESDYKFQKARLYFEQLTQTSFKMDHFSGTLRKENE